MKKNKFVNIAAVSLTILIGISFADDCNVSSFVQLVNEKWVARDYSGIHDLIESRLDSCTNDVVGLGLKYQYYYWAAVDFSNAQAAAQTFITVVSNLSPDEVNQPGVYVDEAVTIARMATPSPFPTNQTRTPAQIEYIHGREFPTNFPYIDFLVELADRLNE